MSKIELSLIIPCYNVSKTIEALLHSVLSQWDEISTEIICIDDGSMDGTVGILEKYSDKLKIIKCDHRGVSEARNIGLKSAVGEWIWFVDADDIVYDGAFETIKLYLDNSKADVLFFGAKVLNNPTMEKKVNDILPENKKLIKGEVFSTWINKYCYPYVWNCLYRRNFLCDNNISFASDLGIGEDMAFQMAVFARAKEVEMISYPIYIYRFLFNERSIMRETMKISRIPFHIEVLDEILKNNTSMLNKSERNMLYEWACGYVVEPCFKNPAYLPLLVTVWRRNKARYPYKGLKNRLKGFILYSRLFAKCYSLYKTSGKK